MSRTRYIKILSDEDMKKRNLSGREIHIKNFIMVAKRIVEDDELIIDCVLSRAKELLEEIIYSNSDDSFLEMITRDILINFFDIAYQIKEGQLARRQDYDISSGEQKTLKTKK